MNVTSVALDGMQAAEGALEKAAARLAGIGAAGADAAPVDGVDLSVEMLALLAARNAFETNARVIQTADEMQKTLLDLLA